MTKNCGGAECPHKCRIFICLQLKSFFLKISIHSFFPFYLKKMKVILCAFEYKSIFLVIISFIALSCYTVWPCVFLEIFEFDEFFWTFSPDILHHGHDGAKRIFPFKLLFKPIFTHCRSLSPQFPIHYYFISCCYCFCNHCFEDYL